MPPLDPERENVGWWAFGLGLLALLGYVLYSFIGTVVFGVFLYYSTRPLYKRIRRRVRPASLAAAVALVALALPALLLVSYSLLVAFRELERVTRQTAFDPAQYLGIDEELLERVADPQTLLAMDWAQYVTVGGIRSVLNSLQSAVGTLSTVGIGVLHLFIIIAIAFYLLRDDHRISRWARTQFGDDQGVLESYLHEVDRDLDSIFFGNILNAVFTGTIGVIAYSLLNVVFPPELRIPAAALVGLLAGVASLVPVVGMKLVYIPVAVYMSATALVQGQVDQLWVVGAFLVVSFTVVDTFPDLILRPYVSGRNLHVGSVMIAYLLGPLLFGWYGLFLMPMLLVIVVHFGRVVVPRLLEPTPIQPYMVDPSHLVDPTDGPQSEAPGDSEMPGEPASNTESEMSGDRKSPGDGPT